MWKPDESLDDFIVKPEPDLTSKPPRKVWLRRTDEVEILKPLAVAELPHSGRVRNAQPLWFRRFIAAGSGALAVAAFVLVSAILIGITEPPTGPDLAANDQFEDKTAEIREPFDLLSPSNFAPVELLRASVRRIHARPSVRVAEYRPVRSPRPNRVVAEEPKFVPTTLVIYAENGVINSRIEPWLQAELKRPTFNN